MEKVFCANCRHYDAIKSQSHPCSYKQVERLNDIDCITGKNKVRINTIYRLTGEFGREACYKANRNFDCKYYEETILEEEREALLKPQTEPTYTSFLKKIINLITRRK